MSFDAIFQNPLGKVDAVPLLSSELPKHVGPHAAKAIAALRKGYRRWFKHQWGREPSSADATVYSVAGWTARGEPYHQAALAVVTFEGEAAEFFNSGQAQKALEPLGYYLEWGHHWNAGIYAH